MVFIRQLNVFQHLAIAQLIELCISIVNNQLIMFSLFIHLMSLVICVFSVYPMNHLFCCSHVLLPKTGYYYLLVKIFPSSSHCSAKCTFISIIFSVPSLSVSPSHYVYRTYILCWFALSAIRLHSFYDNMQFPMSLDLFAYSSHRLVTRMAVSFIKTSILDCCSCYITENHHAQPL